MKPLVQWPDRVDLESLEVRVGARFRRHLGDVQLVVDVAVDVEPGGDDGVDRLERGRARDRQVPQERAGDRIGDNRALVADDGIVELCLLEIRADAAEHPAGDDDHVRSGRANAPDRLARVRAEYGVLRDERAVEIDREGGDAFGEVGRELDSGLIYGGVPPVDLTT